LKDGLLVELPLPNLDEERKLHKEGFRHVAGVDEAGRGALAGPVVAAAVILPQRPRANWFGQVRDSKHLSATKRCYLFEQIYEVALSVGIGIISHEEIDAVGIVPATRLAMKQAIERLTDRPHSLLIDYLLLPEVPLPQKGIVYGDCRCLSIACASIIAKVSRDRLMVAMDSFYSGYGLVRHKGYGTEEHIVNLIKKGPSEIHRRSFRPVSSLTFSRIDATHKQLPSQL
jgi:ribonuclease HII